MSSPNSGATLSRTSVHRDGTILKTAACNRDSTRNSAATLFKTTAHRDGATMKTASAFCAVTRNTCQIFQSGESLAQLLRCIPTLICIKLPRRRGLAIFFWHFGNGFRICWFLWDPFHLRPPSSAWQICEAQQQTYGWSTESNRSRSPFFAHRFFHRKPQAKTPFFIPRLIRGKHQCVSYALNKDSNTSSQIHDLCIKSGDTILRLAQSIPLTL